MARIWSIASKYDAVVAVELAVCEAYARRGLIPSDAMNRIRKNARIDLDRIPGLERRTRHELVAVLTNLEEHLGDDSRFLHMGLTSSDVLDTVLALQLRSATDLLISAQVHLCDLLRHLASARPGLVSQDLRADDHAHDFAHAAASWLDEATRNLERLRRARHIISVGKISGAVGNFAHVDPDIEAEVCAELGLEPALASNQIIQRDRHAEYCSHLAILASSLERILRQLASFQDTDCVHFASVIPCPSVDSPLVEDRAGLCTLARIVRTNALAALQNVALWHERDLSHSSVERLILPDSTTILDYLLDVITFLLRSVRVPVSKSDSP
jgi:adenylosuccinate lyase